MHVLFEHAQDRETAKIKFEAVIHGAKIKDPLPSQAAESAASDNRLLFRDPADYEKMTMEERQALTKKMKGFYQHTMKQKARMLDSADEV